MSRLQYPLNLNPGQNDYVVFSHTEWRANKDGGPPAPAGSDGIVLYMPTTTPAVSNGADWGAKNFSGPLGQVVRDAAIAATDATLGIDLSSFDAAKSTTKGAIDSFKKAFTDNKDNLSGAGRQLVVNQVAGIANTQPNQLMALAKGQVYNPNVELLYNGPQLRSFNFTFQFAPKSRAEAESVNRIIMEFKKWAAPELIGGGSGGMYKVPHVWHVKYMIGSSVNPNMNAFMPAALADVSVQNNQGMNMHMSFEDGMPIVTTISLNFQEVNVITRDDHEKVGNNVGY